MDLKIRLSFDRFFLELLDLTSGLVLDRSILIQDSMIMSYQLCVILRLVLIGHKLCCQVDMANGHFPKDTFYPLPLIFVSLLICSCIYKYYLAQTLQYYIIVKIIQCEFSLLLVPFSHSGFWPV